MSIQITPIPKLTVLTVPGFTLGTANAAGSAGTAVASDSTLLTFDGTDPAAVAASAAVGSASVSSRRDHVHAGTAVTGTVVDEAITRFNGTGGASLQGYSSLSPTISDAGIISLTSGALKFPATSIASADANTLDDYEQGSWNPELWDSGNNDESATYSSQVGYYTKIGNVVNYSFNMVMTGITGLTTGNYAKIGNLPFVPLGLNAGGGWSVFGYGLNLGTDTVIMFQTEDAIAFLSMYQPGASASGSVTIAQVSADGWIRGLGQYFV